MKLIITTILLLFALSQIQAQLLTKEVEPKETYDKSKNPTVFNDSNGLGLRDSKDSVLIETGQFKKIEFNSEIGLYICTKADKTLKLFSESYGIFDYGYELINVNGSKINTEYFEITSTKGKGLGLFGEKDLAIPPLYYRLDFHSDFEDYRRNGIIVQTHRLASTNKPKYGIYQNGELVLDTIYQYCNFSVLFNLDYPSEPFELQLNDKFGIQYLSESANNIEIHTIVPLEYELIEYNYFGYSTHEIILTKKDSCQLVNIKDAFFQPLTNPIYCKEIKFNKKEIGNLSGAYFIVKGLTHSGDKFSLLYNTEKNLGQQVMKSYTQMKDDFLYTSLDGKMGFFTLENENIKHRIPSIYDHLKLSLYDYNNVMTASKDGKWGIISEENGDVIIPFDYDSEKELWKFVKVQESNEN